MSAAALCCHPAAAPGHCGGPRQWLRSESAHNLVQAAVAAPLYLGWGGYDEATGQAKMQRQYCIADMDSSAHL